MIVSIVFIILVLILFYFVLSPFFEDFKKINSKVEQETAFSGKEIGENEEDKSNKEGKDG